MLFLPTRPRTLRRRIRACLAAALASLAALPASAADDAARAGSRDRDDDLRSGADIRVLLPVAENPASATPPARSEASYRVLRSSAPSPAPATPERAWRWREPLQIRRDDVNVATRLVIQVERDAAPAGDAAAATASEALADLSQQLSNLFTLVPSHPQPAAGDSTGAAVPTDRRQAWEDALPPAAETAQAAIAEALLAQPGAAIRLSAFVVRERRERELAAAEEQREGAWTAAGWRCLAERSVDLPPASLSSLKLSATSPDGAAQVAAEATQALIAWLKKHYIHEAAAAFEAAAPRAEPAVSATSAAPAATRTFSAGENK